MHIPVLKSEVLKYIDPEPGRQFIDCTINGGGHAQAILERTGSKGSLLGIDLTPEFIEQLKKKKDKENWDNLKLVQGNYNQLTEIAYRNDFYPVHGILLDLGFSSNHLEEIERGFSFEKDQRLDMRYNPEQKLTAAEIINKKTKPELEELFFKFGEEKHTAKIVEEIIKARQKDPIKTTDQLVSIIKRAVPEYYQKRRFHPATKVFQALRIAVNKELQNLEEVLPQAMALLKKGGRLVIISFHSLEDQRVKRFFKEQEELGVISVLTPKPISPHDEEVQNNPRARSAKLRACQKIINF